MTRQIPNLKRRQRAYYYRRITVQGGEMVWVRTELLPSDMEGQAYYRAKGFRLEPPEGTEFALNNTVKKEAETKAKAEAEAKDRLLLEQSELMKSLYAEIANLKVKLEDKGTQEGSGKVGRPRKVGG